MDLLFRLVLHSTARGHEAVISTRWWTGVATIRFRNMTNAMPGTAG